LGYFDNIELKKQPSRSQNQPNDTK